MLASAGRPRKACSRCKGHKIRCSGEKPNCRRCLRLKHICNYGVDDGRGAPKASEPRTSPPSSVTQPSLLGPKTFPDTATYMRGTDTSCQTWQTPTTRPLPPVQSTCFGIPMSLITMLIEVYYNNVYNATLLLHKRIFLESLAAGTACPHVVLSVCAFALNFYGEAEGASVLRDHDFSTEWADQAGKIAFQDMEFPTEDHVVTFMNLALFWYSQGNAAQIAHVLGLGSERPGAEDEFKSEVRRRRFWACYLMHCHAIDFAMGLGDSVMKLSLPCREDDYDAVLLRHARVYMSSGETNGGIFCELVKALTFWQGSEVNTLVKSPERSISETLTAVYALDDRISDWWRNLPESLELTPITVPHVSSHKFPNLLLINIVYHQSLCALHASIVPLFCWSQAEDTWIAARQTSAQSAYEHAGAASELIEATLSSLHRLGSVPSFVAYAAYCGCAIQIPFTFSSNVNIKPRAQKNVKSNFKLIQRLAKFWKFTALLESHVRCIYKIHAKHPHILEDEPRAIDATKLTSFKINARHARESILGHVNILWRDGNILPRSTEDVVDLGIEEDDSDDTSARHLPATGPAYGSLNSSTSNPQSRLDSAPQVFEGISEQTEVHVPTTAESRSDFQFQQGFPEIESLDFFRPFHDPEMLDLFPNGQAMEFSFFQTSPASLDFCEMWPA